MQMMTYFEKETEEVPPVGFPGFNSIVLDLCGAQSRRPSSLVAMLMWPVSKDFSGTIKTIKIFQHY